MNFNLECGLQATFFVHQSEGKTNEKRMGVQIV